MVSVAEDVVSGTTTLVSIVLPAVAAVIVARCCCFSPGGSFVGGTQASANGDLRWRMRNWRGGPWPRVAGGVLVERICLWLPLRGARCRYRPE